MVMGHAYMAPVSKPLTAATFAIVTMDGMVQSAMFQVAPVTLRHVSAELEWKVEILKCLLYESSQAATLLDILIVSPLMYPLVVII